MTRTSLPGGDEAALTDDVRHNRVEKERGVNVIKMPLAKCYF